MHGWFPPCFPACFPLCFSPRDCSFRCLKLLSSWRMVNNRLKYPYIYRSYLHRSPFDMFHILTHTGFIELWCIGKVFRLWLLHPDNSTQISIRRLGCSGRDLRHGRARWSRHRRHWPCWTLRHLRRMHWLHQPWEKSRTRFWTVHDKIHAAQSQTRRMGRISSSNTAR